MNNKQQFDLIVIGAGPGGYTAAFYAADKGLKVGLIEKYQNLGGVCLNVGCIPSKALLHIAAFKEEAKTISQHGLVFSAPKIQLNKIREFKESVINKMTGGLKQLAKMRGIEVFHGKATFINNQEIKVSGEKEHLLPFKHAIIATGSSPIVPKPFQLDTPRVMTSTGALKLEDIPKELLVVGGGVIGLEMGSIYASLGSKVTIVEALGQVGGNMDNDLRKILLKKLNDQFENIHVNTMVESLIDNNDHILANYTLVEKKIEKKFDRVLLSIGRNPNSQNLNLQEIGVTVSDRGFIHVDKQMRTSIENIFAIGDVIGNPMLAHKASKEAHIAVEVICQEKSIFDNIGIPAVIYTDPEVAWVGLTENDAKEKNIDYQVGSFSWAASGRATSMSRSDGLTKILFEPKTERVLGVGMVGLNAGELIAEGGLALEMGAVMEDIARTIHAHPTLSETFMESAESLHGMATHIYQPKKSKK